ncbi:hypothetical protein [Blastopirellula marina]|uniref:Uncharacterized protein n=1 Tax=Blastopirellula marina TaxID=124 RepID=A0A2S8GQ05_9BACT|nr:hypothetical protein [Blastopirellula marina]PQO46509.1 hypothetical protein C5Y93_08520 [Blastopirellula marina]
MPTANDIIWGLAVPLLVAAGLRWILAMISDRCCAAVPDKTAAPRPTKVSAWENCLPLAASAAIGYFVLELGPWVPDAHYEWIGAAVLLAVVVASVVGCFTQYSFVRFGLLPLAYAAVVIGVGFYLMPTYPDLSPAYSTYLACWCGGVFVLSVAVDVYPYNGSWPFAVVLIGTCLAAAGIAFLSDSMRFAQVTALAFAATLGLSIIGLLMRRPLLSGLGLPLMVYLAGMLLIAHTNSWSDVSLVSYWLPMVGPFLAVMAGLLISPVRFPKAHAAVVILAAAIPATVGVAMAVVASLPE